MHSPYDVRNAYPSRHTKAEGKFTPQICRSRIFVPANECTRVVPMYPSQSQSAMSHLHSLAQSMYIATFLPEHVLTTCFADYVTSTSGAIRLAFDLLPLASSWFGSTDRAHSPFCVIISALSCLLMSWAILGWFQGLVRLNITHAPTDLTYIYICSKE